jgi:hypothetical protein
MRKQEIMLTARVPREDAMFLKEHLVNFSQFIRKCIEKEVKRIKKESAK